MKFDMLCTDNSRFKRNELKKVLFKKRPFEITIHFVGIGGIGMGGLAKILTQSGYTIHGSDLSQNRITNELTLMGVKINFFHSSKNVIGSDMIVVSSAISHNNVEIIEAKKSGIPIFHRIELLSEIIQHRFNIVVTGTHGKTTTTSIITEMFIDSKFYPNYIIGGFSKSLNTVSNWKIDSKISILELDESDPIFISLKNISILVITNLESDHINNYNNDLNTFKNTFLKFFEQLPDHTKVILCIESPIIRSIVRKINRKIITYGLREEAHFRILSYKQKKNRCYFTISDQLRSISSFRMSVPGLHNVLNATPSIILGRIFRMREKNIKKSIEGFQGVQNRMDFLGNFVIKNKYGNFCKFSLIIDHGHHPNEIQNTIHTIRLGWKSNRIIMIFQPHRYTRFQKFYNYFLSVLKKVDLLLVTDVYPSGEKNVAKFSIRSFYKEMKDRKKIVIPFFDHNQLIGILKKIVQDRDIILIQSASENTCKKYVKLLKKVSCLENC
ncbi:UDP-N-acetylmuramate--L-alanine ligase [Candidatus Riesia pediculischaeffi]|uniref:UDP-N-acetylmuramate--L-alanine ligase n=1 Tax=Candidatus Riesia pediculischaeffi TaxID=428411 RepID=A0A1V0HK38_9ENTR|nr:UDP-N-acetylmuramate--L-alanine ligase [Candidatus Riesia pediculischaeffi]ARC53190.1 hypothetical protein AOQ87_00535 [Candidatus Riesia pediculischaeffi]